MNFGIGNFLFFEIFPHYRRTFFLDIFLPLVLFLSNLLIKQSNRVLVALDALGCYCLFINRLRTGLVPNERKIPSRNRDFPGNVYLAAMFVKWRDRISQLFSRRSLSLSLETSLVPSSWEERSNRNNRKFPSYSYVSSLDIDFKRNKEN